MAADSTIILLAGAPKIDDLKWDDSDLWHDWETPIKRFLGKVSQYRSPITVPPSHPMAKWRVLPTSNAEEELLGTQPQTQFLAFDTKARSGIQESQERLHFLEHSLALLNELASSQIAGPEDSTIYQSTYSMATFTTTTTSSSASENCEASFTASAPTTGHHNTSLTGIGEITDLKRIPPADHITRIHPQTITLNTLAAVISVSPARTVRLRKRTGEMEIVELLLGDETRAGFSISFWLTPVDSQQNLPDDMRDSLRALRAGDVVLAQNVALSAFKGCVYGQSLSRRFARNSTVLSVVESREGLSGLLKAKLKRVEEWRDDFVGRRGGGAKGKRKARELDRVEGEVLPADTQSQDG